jgi:hypothetical protein
MFHFTVPFVPTLELERRGPKGGHRPLDPQGRLRPLPVHQERPADYQGAPVHQCLFQEPKNMFLLLLFAFREYHCTKTTIPPLSLPSKNKTNLWTWQRGGGGGWHLPSHHSTGCIACVAMHKEAHNGSKD